MARYRSEFGESVLSMVIYDRLIEGVVEGSECTEQEERDHWSETLKKHNARGVRVWI